jgi:hypothetical protein
MKRWKKYILPFFTLLLVLFFVVLGAALPYLASQVQDAQISKFQKKMELSGINLTLRQEGDVGEVLRLISREHAESVWEGKTVLAKEDVYRAALDVMETLDHYGLLPEGELEYAAQTDGFAEPQLLVGEDGSSALIWACTWDFNFGTYITVDDATGKAVRIMVKNVPTDGDVMEDTAFWVDKWTVFLQDYYDFHRMDVKVVDGSVMISGRPSWFRIRFSSKDGTAIYDLNLEITSDYVFFNYQ